MDFVGTGRRLVPQDLAVAASMLKVPVATVQGVLDVEAAGRGFDAANRPKILPEPHVFYARLKKQPAKQAKAVKLGVAYQKWGTLPYPKTSSENYHRLQLMMTVDAEIALESTSFGLPQIMGENYKDCGFISASQMFEFFKTGESAQLIAFVHLNIAWGLDAALRRRDAAAYAERYNGPGFKRNGYDTKLLNAWKRRDTGRGLVSLDYVPIDVRGPTIAVAASAAPVPVGPEVPQPVTIVPAAPTSNPTQSVDASTGAVQSRLRELGYYEVGLADDSQGPRTRAAIAAFRLDNHMPVTDENGKALDIDTDLLVALMSAKPREITPARASATTAEVRSTTPIMKVTLWQKIGSCFAMVSAGTATLGQGILDSLGVAKEKIAPVQELLTSVPPWGWGFTAFSIALLIYLGSRAVEVSHVDSYRKGEVS